MPLSLTSIPRRVVLVVGVVLIAILVLATVVVLVVLRKDVLQRSAAQLGNLAVVLSEQSRQTIHSLDLLVSATVRDVEAQQAGTRHVSDRELFDDMNESTRALPHVRGLLVLDRDGIVRLNSREFPATAVPYADRDFFKSHRERPTIALFVGAPGAGRIGGERVQAFSRRVSGAGGEFAGVVVGTVAPEYVENFLGAIDLGVDGRVYLFRDDGVLLLTHPLADRAVGRAFADHPLFKSVLVSGSSGIYRGAGLLNGQTRLIAYQHLKDYPLVVAVSSSEDSILAEWRGDAWRIGGGAAGTALIVAIALFHLLRQMRVTAGLEHDLLETGERLQGIVHSAMDAIITIDEDQNVVLFNDAAERIFDCPAAAATGKSIDRFIPERFRIAHRGHVARFGVTGKTSRRMGERLELSGVRADGKEFPIDASISHFTIEGKTFYTVILRDITDRRQAEAALQQAYHERRTASERLHGIIQSAMDAIITTDHEQRIVQFNEAAERIFRCSERDAIGSYLQRFIPERFRAAHEAHIRKFGETRVTTRIMGAHRMALSGLRYDGEEFPIDASISQVTVDGNKYFTVILRDITERKNAEEALKRSYEELRELSAAMHDVREAERTRIARELHDELAQWLTAIKMDVSWLAARLPREQPLLVEKTEKVKALVDTTVGAVRRIAADLRPVMLDDLGLAPAIESLLHDLSQRTGIVISLDADLEQLDFHDPLATALYRMTQEALTNVARHAAATEVRVIIRQENDVLVLQVRDNGRGFDVEAAARRKSYGVLGIQERAHTLGGKATITRSEAGGTLVEIVVPTGRYLKRRQGA